MGNDADGTELVSIIEKQGFDTSLIQTNPNLPTGIVNVKLDKNNQATYTIVEPVAWDEIQFYEKLVNEVTQAEALVFGSLACRIDTSRETLLKLLDHAKLCIFDMNLRPPHFTFEVFEMLISKTDVLKLNEHELEYLSIRYGLNNQTEEEQIFSVAHKFNLKTVCITLGENGAIVLYQDKLYKHKGYKVDVADTVGAGDAFLATFIKGLIEGNAIEKTLQLSCAAGAFVASKKGANPDYTMEDIWGITKI